MPLESVRARGGGRRGEQRWTRSKPALAGLAFLALMVAACIGTLPWTMGERPVDLIAGTQASVRFDDQDRLARQIPPSWAWGGLDEPENLAGDHYQRRVRELAMRDAIVAMAERETRETQEIVTVEALKERGEVKPTEKEIAAARPFYLLGTDLLGRSLFVRILAGGGISLGIGICAAMLSVLLGTTYGAIAGYAGGRVDAVMMRIVDVLFGLPYILLVVLLAVAVNAMVDDWQANASLLASAERSAWTESQVAALPVEKRADAAELERIRSEAIDMFSHGLSNESVQAIRLVTLLVAIGGVSWLTMARVIRGQVLSMKGQPFVEAARAMGVPVRGLFIRHLLPNLVGPIVVYATLTVPQAILQESFLSFLGIGVMPPMPSWGNLAAEGLTEINPYQSNWWLIVFPCLLLGATLLALNFAGEGLREALDPKRTRTARRAKL